MATLQCDYEKAIGRCNKYFGHSGAHRFDATKHKRMSLRVKCEQQAKEIDRQKLLWEEAQTRYVGEQLLVLKLEADIAEQAAVLREAREFIRDTNYCPPEDRQRSGHKGWCDRCRLLARIDSVLGDQEEHK